jgi:hypothetical protein
VSTSKKLEFFEILQNAGIKTLNMDVETNLSSLIQMIIDVHEFEEKLKEIGTNEERLKLSDEAWQFATEFAQLFTPVKEVMKEFQSANMAISDFYISWLRIEIRVSKVPDGQMQLKAKLLEALEQQKHKFFENDIFVAALVLDPRVYWSQNPKDFYNPALCEKGIQHLEKVHQAIINRAQAENTTVQQVENELDEEMNQILGGGKRRKLNEIIPIRERINDFLTRPIFNSNRWINPIEYWSNKSIIEPEIHSVYQVVFGAAFSKDKTENDFSGFALVHKHLKTLLSDKTLQAIIICKNNLDLLPKIEFNLY